MIPAYHTQTISQVYAEVRSSPSGLSKDETLSRLKIYGPNKLPQVRRAATLLIFLSQFTNPLYLLLFFSAGLSYFLGDWADAAIIAAVILLDVIVGFFQEYKATKSVDTLMSIIVPQTMVIREGVRQTIDSREVVPGDIVILTAGAKVPADLRISQGNDLAIDESMLTGESVPVEKSTGPLFDSDLPIADQTNMVFTGTIIVRGSGKGVVVATGGGTALGNIAAVTTTAPVQETPLTRQLHNFSRAIGGLVMVFAAVVFVLGLATGYPLLEIFQDVVAVSVAAIPEGLPLVVTAALSVAIQKMAKKKAIIRHLPAAETLGSTTVICSDKTGTLTKNEMTVKRMTDGKNDYQVTGEGYNLEGEILATGQKIRAGDSDSLRKLLTVGLLCNESSVVIDAEGVKTNGDPTEIALILSARKGGLLKEEERRRFVKADVLPFDAKRGYMATLHQTDGKRYIFAKGTPEKIAGICEINEEEILGKADAFAREGLRVLAFACKKVNLADKLDEDDVKEGFVYLGLQGMIDPPREDAVGSVSACLHAGIRVVMITGDHAVTAGAIAAKLGITDDPMKVATGYELSKMTDEELSGNLKRVNVYARISPEQKLRIVNLFQKLGEVVAVTGDGVNDAPALKTAHIGVAMGWRGTDVARESADMVIMDDSFGTIVKAIAEARILFENVRKATMFLVPTGFAAIVTVMATMILGLPAPYTAVQLLWINLVTNGLQDVALAFEPGERGVLIKKPRRQSEGIMSRLLIERSIVVGLTIACGVLIVYLLELSQNSPLPYARTQATTVMVLFQFFQVGNARSETRSIFRIPFFSNTMLFGSMVLAVVAQGLAIYFRPLSLILDMTALAPEALLFSTAVAASVILAVEIDKLVRRQRHHIPFSRKSAGVVE